MLLLPIATSPGDRKKATPRGFAPWRPQAGTHELLERVRAVLGEYEDYLPLTIRQIFYRLVGAHEYEKTEHGYSLLPAIESLILLKFFSRKRLIFVSLALACLRPLASLYLVALAYPFFPLRIHTPQIRAAFLFFTAVLVLGPLALG